MVNLMYSIENVINKKFSSFLFEWLVYQLKQWRVPLIIMAVLTFSLYFGYTGSPDEAIQIITLLLILAGGAAIIYWPPLGILALIGSIALPNMGPSNFNLTLVIAGGLSALWLLRMISQRRIKVVSPATTRPLLVLLFIAALAFGFGQLNWYGFASPAPMGAQIAGLSLFFLSAGVFLTVAHQVRQVYWLKWFIWLFLAMGAIHVLSQLFNLPISIFSSDQAFGSIFWVWLLTLSFSQAIGNRELNLIWRILLGGLAAATLYLMVTDFWAWNSGWMPALVSILIITLLLLPRLGLLGVAVGLIMAVVKIQPIIAAVMVGDNEYSLATRLEAWVIVWRIVKVNPILGLGPSNYYAYAPLFPIRGYAVNFNSHQQYIDLIAQTGILGLLAFLWFFIAVGWVAWRLRNKAPDGFPRAYVIGAIGGVVGTLAAGAFGDWVIPFFYNITLGGFRASMLSWLFLGGVIALGQIYYSSDQTKDNE
ncbi:MAG: hypothetical protein KDI79_09325 [Anaerolineae bacterium]|nr:hypothetical protein [Anaerolineae bacterium]